jgi:peptide/nickel transport system substrate-binding protein
VYQPPTKQEVRCGIPQEPQTLDPALTEEYGVSLIAPNIYETLTVLHPAGLTPEPCLATHWEIENNGMNYRFHLRPNVCFHDSTILSAEAVKISFDRQINPNSTYYLDPEGGIYSQTMFEMIDSVDCVDSLTVSFHLKYPYAPFLNILSSVGGAAILSPASLKKSKSGSRFIPISTGPFQFVAWKPNEKIILKRNPNYWDTSPRIDLSFRFFNATESLINQFQHEAIDVIFSVSPNLRERFLFDQNSQIQVVQALSTFFLGLNCRNPLLADPRVRQAIAAAIDKKKLVYSLYHGGAEIAESILPPRMLLFKPEKTEIKPIQATRLVGGTDFSSLPPLKLVCYRHSDRDLLFPKAIQMFLAKIGIRVDIQVIDDWNEFDALMKTGQSDLFLDGWGSNFADPDDFLFSLFHSKSPANLFFYANPQVDELLETARSLFAAPEKRAQIYLRVLQILDQDMPCVPLTHQLPMIITSNKIKNFQTNQLGYPIFKKVNKDDASK